MGQFRMPAGLASGNWVAAEAKTLWMTPRRLLTISWLFLVPVTVSGCTNCGWIWEDWMNPQNSCRNDRQPEQK